MCWGISNNSNTAMLNDTACRCELCEGRAAGKSEAPASRRSAGQDRRPNETAPPTLAEQAKRRGSIYRRIECTTFAPPMVAGLFICAETLKDPRAARLRVEVAAMPQQMTISLRSCSVRSPMTERSIALSAKRRAYSDKPSCPSQSAIFCITTFPLPRSPHNARTLLPLIGPELCCAFCIGGSPLARDSALA